MVQSSKATYISVFSLRRYLFRQNSNRKLLEKLVATNDLGQQYTLAELSDLSISNPAIRRTEHMVRLRSFET